MPETIDTVIGRISYLTQHNFRGRLGSRGTARSMVWRNGALPEGSPAYGEELTEELLSYGFSLLRVALKAYELEVYSPEVRSAFEISAEAIEAVIKNGDPEDEAKGFYRVLAASAYHLGGFAARAFSLASKESNGNYAQVEIALSLLILRRLEDLQRFLLDQINSPQTSEDNLIKQLESEESSFELDDALVVVTIDNYLRACSCLLFALRTNDERFFSLAKSKINEGEKDCSELGMVPLWWVHRVTKHLFDDLWRHSLGQLLPVMPGEESQWNSLREQFIGLLACRNIAEIDLWPSQCDAAERSTDQEDNLVVSLPTSAGKTRIAELCILRTLSLGKRIVFVTPLRALSAQTERTLRNTFSPLGFSVSSLYGSAGVSASDLDSLQGRSIVVSTPEKLDFALRNNPELLDDVGLVVLDEGHMLGASEREIRYEVLVQRLLRREDSANRRLVCLSAMLPSQEETDDFVAWIRNGQEGESVRTAWRPTRLRFGHIVWKGDRAEYEVDIEGEKTFIRDFVKRQVHYGPKGGEKPFPKTRGELALAAAWRLAGEAASVLIYCPQRSSTVELSEKLLTVLGEGYLAPLENFDPAGVESAFRSGCEWLGSDHPVVKSLRVGVAVHHARLPRPYLKEIDTLIRERRVPIVVASPTLSQGLNISASYVLFQSTDRFDPTIGENGKIMPISSEEFANVSGRAGRAYVDVDGQVLGVCLTDYQKKKWDTAVRKQHERHLESGLLEIVNVLLLQLQKKVPVGADFSEYILNNAQVWDAPSEDEREISQWQSALDLLDIALLSLISEEECSVDTVTQLLDKVLADSFLKRRMARRTEHMRNIINAFYVSRAKFICATTTPEQRRGYFFSGIGLSTGKAMEAVFEPLCVFLKQAEDAITSGNYELLIENISNLFEVISGIDPFSPREELPVNWRQAISGWLSGSPINELEKLGEDIASFIEDAIVYRLAWGIEAVRVHSRALGQEIFDDKPCRIIPLIETGTVIPEVAVLLQAGLGSRIAAHIAIRDCPGAFSTFKQMRSWLATDPVKVMSTKPDWPSFESAMAWAEFLAIQEIEREHTWFSEDSQLSIDFAPGDHPLSDGEPVFLYQPDDKIQVYSPEGDWLGISRNTFAPGVRNWAVGVKLSSEKVLMHYVGPKPIRK